MIQVYGHWNGHVSFAKVSKRIVQELKNAHLLGSVFPTNTLTPPDAEVRWEYLLRSTAEVGIYVGYPPTSTKWLKGHAHRVLVTVCETDKIPADWVTECNTATLIVVPSAYCAWVYKNSGVKTPIMTVPHGVDPGYAFATPKGVPGRDRPARILHVTGAISFPRRKGTPQLLKALEGYDNIRLVLKTADYSGIRKFTTAVENRPISVVTKHWSLAEWAICLPKFDAVIQPSQGEGFGCVPLEARCAGVPVLLTPYHGHQEHYAVNVDIPIKADQTALMTTQGNSVGSGPIVEASRIREALDAYLTDPILHRDRARAWAREKARFWTWHQQLKPFVHLVTEWERRVEHATPIDAGLFA